MGQAALRDQKIGNALRTIDTWYPAYEERRVPLPVEPNGASLDAQEMCIRDRSMSSREEAKTRNAPVKGRGNTASCSLPGKATANAPGRWVNMPCSKLNIRFRSTGPLAPVSPPTISGRASQYHWGLMIIHSPKRRRHG